MDLEFHSRSSHQRAKRLRSSCDACGFSKVKCDRGQPQCARCVSLNLNCIYGPSRQSGRKPRRNLNLSRHNSNVTRFSGSSVGGQTPHVSDDGVRFGAQQHQFSSNVLSTSVDNGISNAPDEPNICNVLSTGSENFDHLMYLPNEQDIWLQQQFNDFSTSSTLTSNNNSKNDYTVSGTHEEEIVLPHPQTPAPGRNKRHECFHEPNQVLQSLTFRNVNYDSIESGHSGKKIVPLSQILHANKSAVESFHRFLKCICSRAHPSLVMLQASLVSRVLFFYREAAGLAMGDADNEDNDEDSDEDANDHEHDTNIDSNHNVSSSTTTTSPPPEQPIAPPTSSLPTPPPQPPTRETCFVITNPPFKIGTFDIDHAGIQSALRNQLIASEVRKLLPVVSGFVALGRDDQAAVGIDGIDHRAMYQSVGAWLEGEYRRTAEVFGRALEGL